jgi:hypothetical protein
MTEPETEFEVVDVYLSEMTETLYPLFRFTSSGSAQYFHAYFAESGSGNNFYWNVYGEFSDDVNFEFPVIDKKLVDQTGLYLPHNLSCQSLSYHIEDDYPGYIQWCQRNFQNQYSGYRTDMRFKEYHVGL